MTLKAVHEERVGHHGRAAMMHEVPLSFDSADGDRVDWEILETHPQGNSVNVHCLLRCVPREKAPKEKAI